MKKEKFGKYYLVKDITQKVNLINIPDIDSLDLVSQILLYNLKNPDK